MTVGLLVQLFLLTWLMSLPVFDSYLASQFFQHKLSTLQQQKNSWNLLQYVPNFFSTNNSAVTSTSLPSPASTPRSASAPTNNTRSYSPKTPNTTAPLPTSSFPLSTGELSKVSLEESPSIWRKFLTPLAMFSRNNNDATSAAAPINMSSPYPNTSNSALSPSTKPSTSTVISSSIASTPSATTPTSSASKSPKPASPSATAEASASPATSTTSAAGRPYVPHNETVNTLAAFQPRGLAGKLLTLLSRGVRNSLTPRIGNSLTRLHQGNSLDPLQGNSLSSEGTKKGTRSKKGSKESTTASKDTISALVPRENILRGPLIPSAHAQPAYLPPAAAGTSPQRRGLRGLVVRAARSVWGLVRGPEGSKGLRAGDHFSLSALSARDLAHFQQTTRKKKSRKNGQQSTSQQPAEGPAYRVALPLRTTSTSSPSTTSTSVEAAGAGVAEGLAQGVGKGLASARGLLGKELGVWGARKAKSPRAEEPAPASPLTFLVALFANTTNPFTPTSPDTLLPVTASPSDTLGDSPPWGPRGPPLPAPLRAARGFVLGLGEGLGRAAWERLGGARKGLRKLLEGEGQGEGLGEEESRERGPVLEDEEVEVEVEAAASPSSPSPSSTASTASTASGGVAVSLRAALPLTSLALDTLQALQALLRGRGRGRTDSRRAEGLEQGLGRGVGEGLGPGLGVRLLCASPVGGLLARGLGLASPSGNRSPAHEQDDDEDEEDEGEELGEREEREGAQFTTSRRISIPIPMPPLPPLPALPSMPSLPTLPSLPAMPSISTLSTLSMTSMTSMTSTAMSTASPEAPLRPLGEAPLSSSSSSSSSNKNQFSLAPAGWPLPRIHRSARAYAHLTARQTIFAIHAALRLQSHADVQEYLANFNFNLLLTYLVAGSEGIMECVDSGGLLGGVMDNTSEEEEDFFPDSGVMDNISEDIMITPPGASNTLLLSAEKSTKKEMLQGLAVLDTHTSRSEALRGLLRVVKLHPSLGAEVVRDARVLTCLCDLIAQAFGSPSGKKPFNLPIPSSFRPAAAAPSPQAKSLGTDALFLVLRVVRSSDEGARTLRSSARLRGLLQHIISSGGAMDYTHLSAAQMARVAAWGLGGVPFKPRVPGQRGLRILSFDGGGTRGVLTISLLKELFQRINSHSTGAALQPHDVFDIVCGTSTGGIIAMLLGGQGRSINETEAFENILYSMGGDMLMLDTNVLTDTRVFMVSTMVNTNPPQTVIWRNYNYPPPAASGASAAASEEDCLFYAGSCRIPAITAVRATTAAPTFFTPVLYEGGLYCDGALVANNPTALALQEAKRLYPNTPVECVVSTGIYYEARSDMTSMPLSLLVNQLIASSTDTEEKNATVLEGLKKSAQRYMQQVERDRGGLEALVRLLRGEAGGSGSGGG
eukprot:gene23912-28955_t